MVQAMFDLPYRTLLPERHYVTFGYLLSQIRLSSVCLSVTFVHSTQGLMLSVIFLRHCVPQPSFDLRAKFYGDRPRGTPPSGALNARGVSKLSDFGPIEGYPISHKWYKIQRRVQLMSGIHLCNFTNFQRPWPIRNPNFKVIGVFRRQQHINRTNHINIPHKAHKL